LEGFSVAGLLAPVVYKDKQLVGFGAVDLGQAKRIALASQRVPASKREKLVFTEAGLKLGKAALSLPAVRAAELVIVDEFGPLELAEKGWRKEIDLLLASTDALVVLIVREELQEKVQNLYKNYPSLKLAANKQESVNEVVNILRNRRFVAE